MPVCTRSNAQFRPLGRRKIVTNFCGGNITSDGGAPLLREVDRRLKLCERIAQRMNDPRCKAMCDHQTVDLVRQRIYGLALGYEDLNDHDTLRDDIAIQMAVSRNCRLASPATLCRLERHANEEAARALQGLLVDLFIEDHDDPPEEIILDFDATDDIVHGQQENRAFNAHYDNHIFLPLYVVCGSHVLVAWLRPGSSGAATGTEGWLTWLVERLRAAWPNVRIVLRADAGFAKPAIYRCCEALDVDYIIGLGKNQKLIRLSAEWMAEAERQAPEAEHGRARVFGELSYRAGTWRRDRRVLVKAEHNGLGANPRYVVTSLEGEPQALYEQVYCARCDMENRIKEQQLGLFADRTSSTSWWTNQHRLLLSTFAYALMDFMRRHHLHGTELANAYVGTIRLKLLKIGGVVRRNTRRVELSLSSCYPRKWLFGVVLKRAVAA